MDADEIIDNYEVIKNEDANRFLSADEISMLNHIIFKINKGRQEEGLGISMRGFLKEMNML